MIFSIYADSVDGTAMWFQPQSVTVNNGVFNVLLGTTPFPDTLFLADADLYLGIKVNDDPEMRPRFQLTGVPFAFKFNRTPIVARWYATNNGKMADGANKSPVNYQWGKMIFNSNPAALTTIEDDSVVLIKVPGYYSIEVNVLQYGLTADAPRGDVYIIRNEGEVIGSSLENRVSQDYCQHNISIIEYFNKDDKISIKNAGEDNPASYPRVYGKPDHWSNLQIQKID